MNIPGGHLLWPLWALSCYLILTRTPRPPRTAESPGRRILSGGMSLAIPVLAILLANLLAWIACCRQPVHPGQGWMILATAFGIGLLPFAFQTSPLSGAMSLESISRFMAGLAWASCWTLSQNASGPGAPLLLIVGAACAVLPDTLDHWISRLIHPIDIHIVPDPLEPDPALVATALADAMARCQVTRTPVRPEVYPGQNRDGQWLRYVIRLGGKGDRIRVTTGDRSVSAPLPARVTSDHPFTVTTGDGPVSLQFSPLPDRRIEMRVMPWRRGWSHSLALATGVGLIVGWVWGVGTGGMAGGAVVLHLVLDQAGFTGVKAFLPFSGRGTTGFQLLQPSQARLFHAAVVVLALLITLMNAGPSVTPG